jgi:UDP-N-acetylglucosamine 4,6-dehydratase/5-epimerase
MTTTSTNADPAGLSAALGPVVAITGGTGSLGKALVDRLTTSGYSGEIRIISRDELKQAMMRESGYDQVDYLIADVRDQNRLEQVVRGSSTVIHTAAMKRFEVAEKNPYEAILTNTVGSENVIRASYAGNVARTILVSSDKAVEPVNLYGATKLAAERLFVAAAANATGTAPIFSTVRYGNVLGSRGSLLDILYRAKVSSNKSSREFHLRDSQATRFHLTLPDAVGVVEHAVMSSYGGEIFVPRLPAYSVKRLIELSFPEITIANKDLGLLPGEKLHESLVSSTEQNVAFETSDREMIVIDWSGVVRSDRAIALSKSPIRQAITSDKPPVELDEVLLQKQIATLLDQMSAIRDA